MDSLTDVILLICGLWSVGASLICLALAIIASRTQDYRDH